LLTRHYITNINAQQRKLELPLQTATLSGIQESPLYAKKLEQSKKPQSQVLDP
jgi:hypothetical protein